MWSGKKPQNFVILSSRLRRSLIIYYIECQLNASVNNLFRRLVISKAGARRASETSSRPKSVEFELQLVSVCLKLELALGLRIYAWTWTWTAVRRRRRKHGRHHAALMSCQLKRIIKCVPYKSCWSARKFVTRATGRRPSGCCCCERNGARPPL